MLRRLYIAFVLSPVGLLIIALAVANRQAVTISFDPFSTTHPALVTTLPVYGLGFILLTTGVVIGGIAAWLKQRKWRRTARRFDAENRSLRTEIEVLRRRAGLGPRTTLPARIDHTPPAVMRPPAA